MGRALVAVSFRCFGGCLGCSMWWLRWGTGMFITLFGELIWVGLLVVGVEFDVVSRCRCGFRVFGLDLGLALVLNVAMVLVGRFLILFRIWFGVDNGSGFVVGVCVW